MVANKGKGPINRVAKGFFSAEDILANGNNKPYNAGVLLKYIDRIREQEGISEYRFNKDNGLGLSFCANLRRLRDNHPSAYRYKISFDMLVNLSLRYGVPFLASDYLDISGNYLANSQQQTAPKKQAKKATKGTKKAKQTPPKPTFL